MRLRRSGGSVVVGSSSQCAVLLPLRRPCGAATARSIRLIRTVQYEFHRVRAVEASWSYGGQLDGWLETDVEAGDVITVDGRISVSYIPGGFADGIPAASRVGDTILTVGRLNE